MCCGTAVGVAVASEPGGPSIAVGDAGVAVEDRKLIFERFARARHTTRARDRGLAWRSAGSWPSG
jgi:hypothetical protein